MKRLPRKRKEKLPVLRLMSGDLKCAICRERIARFDDATTRDETFVLLSDGRPVHSRCLRNDPLDGPKPSKRRAREAAAILARARRHEDH